MKAILCNKQNRALECTIEDGKITNIGEVYNKEALPLCLQETLNLESINKWLSKRKMPLTREGLKEARQTFGSKYYNNYTRMFALTDQYWFKIRQTDSWRKFNFFTNPYSSAIGQTLFAPWGEFSVEELRKESPDLTTNGVCRKVWIQNPNTLTSYLVKAGSKKYMQEPISEVLASMTLSKINLIPFVRYDLYVNNLHICSKCKNFVDQHTEFVPAQYIYDLEKRRADRSQYEHLLLMCDKYGLKNSQDFIDKMILCDYFIGNTDRHLGNFGALRNVDTGEVIGFAPLFDFGSAFHEFNPGKEDKPRFFGDQIDRVLEAYLWLPELKNLIKNDDLFHIIDMYPDLTAEQKEAIKAGIVKRTTRFEFIPITVDERRKYEQRMEVDMDMFR